MPSVAGDHRKAAVGLRHQVADEPIVGPHSEGGVGEVLLRIRLTGAVLFYEDVVGVGGFNGEVLGEDVVHGLDQSESLILGGLEGQEGGAEARRVRTVHRCGG